MIKQPESAAIDILILSNGPGELATWVRPMGQALRQVFGDDKDQVRLSVMLSPCPHATGQEAAIARSYPDIDRVQAAEHFWSFLLTGQTIDCRDWRPRGVVLFLGGDQFFAVMVGQRLGYRTVVYAEWEARWWRWIDRFAVMRPATMSQVAAKYIPKFAVIGDLMADIGTTPRADELKVDVRARPELTAGQSEELIGLLPGSKAAKLAQGVPLMLAIAEQIHQVRPQTRFVIPVAPTLDLMTLARFADPRQNPISALVSGVAARLVQPESASRPYLETPNGLRVELWQSLPGAPRTPPYDLLAQCCLCLTTVGANTAELGALAVPMVVIVPTQQLDAMRSWDGIWGLLANLPGVGSGFAKIINGAVLRRIGLMAWPNIWAKTTIVPELVGHLQPLPVAELMLDYLAHPAKLQAMQSQLRQIRGEGGAAQKLAAIVKAEADKTG